MRKYKYPNFEEVIFDTVNGKDFKQITMQDFPAYRYFFIWKTSYLTTEERTQWRAYRRALSKAKTAANLLALNKCIRQQKENARSERKKQQLIKKQQLAAMRLIKKPINLDKKPFHKIEAALDQSRIVKLTDGSAKIYLDSKTVITVKAGKNPHVVLQNFKNRNIGALTGSANPNYRSAL